MMARLNILQHHAILCSVPFADESAWRRAIMIRTFTNLVFFEALDEGLIQFLILTGIIGKKHDWESQCQS